jgi:hypothetical protein
MGTLEPRGGATWSVFRCAARGAWQLLTRSGLARRDVAVVERARHAVGQRGCVVRGDSQAHATADGARGPAAATREDEAVHGRRARSAGGRLHTTNAFATLHGQFLGGGRVRRGAGKPVRSGGASGTYAERLDVGQDGQLGIALDTDDVVQQVELRGGTTSEAQSAAVRLPGATAGRGHVVSRPLPPCVG